MNRDFAEMLAALSAAGADFLIVGAYALAAFGAPLADVSVEDLSTPGIVFQIGIVPARIDILTSLTGLDFESAWSRRQILNVEGRDLPFLSREDLIRNKTALGRPRDLADIDDLTRR